MRATPNANAPIGVFDSGIGGLTVVRELMRQLPNERIIYFGDTARVPYGPKSPDTVRRYAREIATWLQHQGVKSIVVACNTASAYALPAEGGESRFIASSQGGSTPHFGADPERVNVNGGAVALGHPIGASGARILSTMIYELRRNGGGLGLAAICSGGGQGDALLIEV